MIFFIMQQILSFGTKDDIPNRINKKCVSIKKRQSIHRLLHRLLNLMHNSKTLYTSDQWYMNLGHMVLSISFIFYLLHIKDKIVYEFKCTIIIS